MRTTVVSVLGVCVLAGAVWFWQVSSAKPAGVLIPDNAVVSNPSSTDGNSEGDNQVSPFSVKEPPATATVSQIVVSNNAGSASPAPLAAEDQGSEAGRLLAKSIDVTSLGHSAMDDAEFLQLADALRSDPVLLQQLIDEFRQETDATRRAALSRILGEVGGDGVMLTASELIYSGDDASRRIGLELLQKIQPGNPAARDIASTLLATEVEPTILVDTLTTLARPGTVDDNSRQILSDQVAFLTDHEDSRVRSVSLNILSRWSKDGQYTDVLRNGLSDQEPVVRESAAYALVGHKNASQTLIDSLLSVAIDASENTQVRRGAILALKGMPIDNAVRQQVTAAELELDTVRR